MYTVEIDKRFSQLAEQECCLSSGGAFDLSQPNEGEVFVYLGCGKGSDLMRLREAVGEGGFVYGVDISERMLTKARKNIEKFGYTNVSLVRSELESIQLEGKVRRQ